MAFRVFLRPPLGSWRRVNSKQAQQSGQLQLRRLLQLGRAISKTSENEWSLDLDTDTEEINHAPRDEEPHPPHPAQQQHRSSTSRDGRLLFNIGTKLMTADEFVKKANSATRRTHITLDMSDYEDGSVGEEGEEGAGWVEWGVEVEREGERKETGKKRGIQSMRQARKFLRGKALTGSRLTTPPSPETTELLGSLEGQLSLGAGHREVFSSVPSVLGSEGREMKERVRELRRLGFTWREVEAVLVSFPAILQVNFQNVYEVCGVLKKCIPRGYMLRGLLARHPFLFLQPVKQVEERVMVLKDICRDPNALGFLLHHFPILLFTPLTPSTLHTITKFTAPHSAGAGRGGKEEEKGGGLGHSWVAKSLYHNLSTRPARMEPGPDVKALVDLLAEFQLDPAPTFIQFPGFFKATYAHVASLLTVLTGPPLYLDSGAVQTLLCSIPDQLVWTEDAEQLQTHLSQLCSLFPSAKDCYDKVVSYPGLVLPQLDLTSWLDSLASRGFSPPQSALLVSETPNILLQDREKEFLPRLRLLLSLPEATSSSLTSCSVGSRIRMFSTPIDVLTQRLNYVKRHKPEMVSGQHLEEIFGSKEREFAAFCGRTVEQVHSGTGLSGIELRRFKSTKKSSTKIREKLVCKHDEAQPDKNCHVIPSNVASCDPPAGDNRGEREKTDVLGAPKNIRSSAKIRPPKNRKSQQKSSTPPPLKKKKREAKTEDGGQRVAHVMLKMAPGDNGDRRSSCEPSLPGGVLTEDLTTTYGDGSRGNHTTADLSQTSTVATSPGKRNCARKQEKHVK